MSATKLPYYTSSIVFTRQGSLLSLAILTLITFTYVSLTSLHSKNSHSPSQPFAPPSLPVVEDEEILDVYHSPELFRLNYVDMERQFKVYIYPDGGPKTFYQTPRKLTGKYASEGYFFQNIRESRFQTDDPDQAHLFFYPDFLS